MQFPCPPLYLEDNKIIFDECTDPPHAEIIGNVMSQITMQDWPASAGEFVSGSSNRASLFILLLIKI
jgi:hypothetical protein